MRGNRNGLLATIQFPPHWTNPEFFVLGRALIKALGFTELRNAQCLYEADPAKGGMTFVFFLAESHLILETFREDGYVAELEIITCRKGIPLSVVRRVLEQNDCKILGKTRLDKQEDDRWHPS